MNDAPPDARYLRELDGVASRLIFCAWTGGNPMSGNRIQAFYSLVMNSGCALVTLDHRSMYRWQHPEHPFHPSFDCLSATHKADYLRCYLMHHYGGGYSDLKRTQQAWWPFFARLDESAQHLALGYTEIHPRGVAPVPEPLGQELRENYQKLIGLCAFIFRKRSVLTTQWLDQTHQLLDQKLAALQAHPARHPQEFCGAKFEDGSLSQYPLGWTEMLGNIFHPLIYQHAQQVLHADIAPVFVDYR